MKFIFPQNYNFKNKLFGVIDYITVFINILWYCLVLLLINLIFDNITTKVFLFIIFCLPLLIFSFSGFNGESIVYVFSYIIKFVFRPKLYLYKKNNNNEFLHLKNNSNYSLNFLSKKVIICITKFIRLGERLK